MNAVPDVIFNSDPVRAVAADTIAHLKSLALQSPRRRSRLCLHYGTNDPTQEMVIVLHRDTLLAPHRHPGGKSESYHVIEGAMNVFVFHEDGRVRDRLTLSAPGGEGAFLYRLSEPLYHLPIVTSEWVVYHEIFTGPFNKDEDVHYAPWAPPESEPAALAAFYQSLLR